MAGISASRMSAGTCCARSSRRTSRRTRRRIIPCPRAETGTHGWECQPLKPFDAPDRFRCGGRESKFLQRRSHAPAARHAVLKICVVPPRKPLFSGDRFRKWPLSSALYHHGLSNLLRVCVAERVSSSSPLSCLPRLFSSPRRASWPLRASWPRRPSSWPLRLPSF